MLREVFFYPGLCLLFGGLLIGYISLEQGADVTKDDVVVFLGLFLLEMGMTASRQLKHLQRGGIPFMILGTAMPIVFAMLGILVAHFFGMAIQQELTLGTSVLFSVLCAAASDIAVPAVQRLAIPEASPTLPLAASHGLTFSFNVTIGVPMSSEIARQLSKAFPAA